MGSGYGRTYLTMSIGYQLGLGANPDQCGYIGSDANWWGVSFNMGSVSKNTIRGVAFSGMAANGAQGPNRGRGNVLMRFAGARPPGLSFFRINDVRYPIQALSDGTLYSAGPGSGDIPYWAQGNTVELYIG